MDRLEKQLCAMMQIIERMVAEEGLEDVIGPSRRFFWV